MRIEVRTVYSNVDQSFLDFYIKELKRGKMPIDFEDLRNGEFVSFTSKDPTSNVVGTTSYQLHKDDNDGQTARREE